MEGVISKRERRRRRRQVRAGKEGRRREGKERLIESRFGLDSRWNWIREGLIRGPERK